MTELIAHELIQHDNLKKWIVFTNDDVIMNYGNIFGEDGVYKLSIAVHKMQKDFYEIKRYKQFVGVVRYTYSMGMLTMNLFESENMDNFLDGVLDLKDQNWKSEDIKIIGEITQQILDDKNGELARIRLKKLL